jgi:hypothetical protein
MPATLEPTATGPTAVLLLALAVLRAGSPVEAAPEAKPAKPAFRAGTIEQSAIAESSGLVASRVHEGVFWTINDSGHEPVLYAVTREGKSIAEFAVGAKNTDWEDLATDGTGHVYVADVGNNGGRRDRVRVLRIDEPDPRAAPPAKALPVSAAWELTYPGRPFDSEALFVLDGKGYLISKRLDGRAAEVYRFGLAERAPGAEEPVVLERVAALPVRAPVTAADVSPDGRRLAVLTVLGAYVFDIDGDVAAAGNGAPARYARYIHPRMEAACFVPGGLLVTAETREVLFFADEYFKPVD